jgi:hypothetical protein
VNGMISVVVTVCIDTLVRIKWTQIEYGKSILLICHEYTFSDQLSFLVQISTKEQSKLVSTWLLVYG